jgi:hypothetical protein
MPRGKKKIIATVVETETVDITKETMEDLESCPNCDTPLTVYSVLGGKRFCSDKCGKEYLGL